MTQILITGATSKVGHRLVEQLSAKGYKVKAAARNPESCKKRYPDTRAVYFDYDRADSWDSALDEVTTVFLTVPPLDAFAHTRAAPFVERMQAAGVKRVVLLSAFGANMNAESPLAVLENQLATAPFESTALRPNWFMENFTEGFFAPTIIQQDAVFFAAGDGAVSFISANDIAAAAMEALTRAATPEPAYDLTGPDGSGFAHVAEQISEATGRKITYHAISDQDQTKALLEQGMPESSVAYLGVMCSAIREGWAAPTTADLEKLTGSKGITLADFVKENALTWKRP